MTPLPLSLLTSGYASAIALANIPHWGERLAAYNCDRESAQSLTMRFPAEIAIASQPWVKLWLLCRALDFEGKGWVILSIERCCGLLKSAKSTFYQYLRSGKQAQGFRDYCAKGGDVYIKYGSHLGVAAAMNLKDLGAVATFTPANNVLEFVKPTATAIIAQSIQARSRIAAQKSLRAGERRRFKIPTATQILEAAKEGNSLKNGTGVNPYLLAIGQRKIYVSKSFVPIGSSQRGIANATGKHPTTVRRHLKKLNVERRQIVQAKGAYKHVVASLKLGLSQAPEPTISCRVLEQADGFDKGSAILTEPNGTTAKSRTYRVSGDRFFSYWGKTWIYRCNLYQLDYKLCSVKALRARYKSLQNAPGSGFSTLSDLRSGPEKGEQNR